MEGERWNRREKNRSKRERVEGEQRGKTKEPLGPTTIQERKVCPSRDKAGKTPGLSAWLCDLIWILVNTQIFRQTPIYMQIWQMHMEYSVLTTPSKKKIQGFLNKFLLSVFCFALLCNQSNKTKVLEDFIHPHNDLGRNMKPLQLFVFSGLTLELVWKIRGLVH